MIKKIIFLGLLSIATASSAWFWTKTYHAVEHQEHVFVHHDLKKVQHVAEHQAEVLKNKDLKAVAKTVRHQSDVFALKDLPAAGHAIAHAADSVCRDALSIGIKGIVGVPCKAAVTEFMGECVASLDAETEGAATPLCVIGSVVLKKECSMVVSSAVEGLVIDKVCGK